jgi:DNA-binding transcriptional MerR regulator
MSERSERPSARQGEYRVAELARAADTTVRNVRVYQDRGLLPPPRRQGRIGLYNDAHLARLRLIGRLLARGYTFATIGELFGAWNEGRDLADTLGLREALTAPWTEEEPIRLSRTEVAKRFGMPFSEETVARAVELGMLVRDRGSFIVPSPSLFDAGAELAAAGVPIEVVLDLAAALQSDMTRVAQRFISVVLTHLTDTGSSTQLTAPLSGETAERLLRLRPYAQRTVDAVLLQAMQKETDRLLERLAPGTGHEQADAG